MIVEEGSVISMGVFIGQSTKIFDRETGEKFTMVAYQQVQSLLQVAFHRNVVLTAFMLQLL